MIREGKQHVPGHLGGHFGWAQMNLGVLRRLRDIFDPKSFLDIGAGIGEMVTRALDQNLIAVGIEGDANCAGNHPNLIHHDYARGPISIGPFDLGWSVEFLEHVVAAHERNYMMTFQQCKLVMITAAPPGRGGHHHVNCQPQSYWIKVFERYGFQFDADVVADLKEHSLPWLMMDVKTRGTNAFDSMMFFRRT